MEQKIEKMIKKINAEIETSYRFFKWNGKNDWNSIARIHAMIEMLQIVTDKKYSFDETGLIEL